MKHHMTCTVLALTLLTAPTASVFALDAPSLSKADFRVRYVDYNPADVIQLDAVIGVATHIVLEPGEEYRYHVFGDSAAYGFTYKDNHLFFKPVAEDANTNLIVVTNRRDYAFRISYSDNRNGRALYKLVVRYPDSDRKREAAAAQKAAISSAFSQVGQPINWETYTRSGNAPIAPVHTWDDGRQTWMQFASEADIPTVYRVTPDGQEVITNYHMADSRTMVLHRTSALWHLRLGRQVLAIQNGGYGKTPAPAHTGTASPNVQRVVKGAAPQTLPPSPDISKLPPEVIRETAPDPASARLIQINTIGDTSLTPTRVWEEAGRTWFQFSRAVPAVYLLDTNGVEQVVNATVYPNNTVAFDSVALRWMVRDGAASLTIDKRAEKWQ